MNLCTFIAAGIWPWRDEVTPPVLLVIILSVETWRCTRINVSASSYLHRPIGYQSYTILFTLLGLHNTQYRTVQSIFFLGIRYKIMLIADTLYKVRLALMCISLCSLVVLIIILRNTHSCCSFQLMLYFKANFVEIFS